MRTLFVALLLLTVACRRPSTQFSAMLTPVNQPDDYTRYLKAGDELVAVGSAPSWLLTVNPSKGVIHFKPQNGDSSIVSLAENQISRTTDSASGAIGYQATDGKIKVMFRPDSCTDKLSGQRYDYHVEVVSQGQRFVGCGVSLRQVALLQDNWLLTAIEGDTGTASGPLKPVSQPDGSQPDSPKLDGPRLDGPRLDGPRLDGPRLDGPRLEISLTQSRVTGTTGCNQLSGPVRADTHQIQFGPLVTTKIACPDSANSRERDFLTLLARPMTYRIDQGRLTLLQNGKPVLTFKKVD